MASEGLQKNENRNQVSDNHNSTTTSITTGFRLGLVLSSPLSFFTSMTCMTFNFQLDLKLSKVYHFTDDANNLQDDKSFEIIVKRTRK